jgi:hypothetical protein
MRQANSDDQVVKEIPSIWINDGGEVFTGSLEALAKSLSLRPVPDLHAAVVKGICFATLVWDNASRRLVDRCASSSTPMTINSLLRVLGEMENDMGSMGIALWISNDHDAWQGPMAFPAPRPCATFLRGWEAAHPKAEARKNPKPTRWRRGQYRLH